MKSSPSFRPLASPLEKQQMASTPVFGSTPRLGSVQLTNADGTGVLDFANFAPVAAGTRVKQIRVASTNGAAPGASRVNILVHDGTNSRVLESFALQNTADILQAIFPYTDFKLPVGCKLQARMLTALAIGAQLDFIVMGEDLT
jgi:hypothetical protein